MLLDAKVELIIIAAMYKSTFPGDLMHRRIIPNSQSWQIIGLAFTIAGLGFAVWARLRLGRNWSGIITLKEDHTLITGGPYAITRHPIYSGALLAIAGQIFLQGELRSLIFFIVLTIGLIIKLSNEEKLLKNHFGDAYEQYAQKTNRLVPFIY